MIRLGYARDPQAVLDLMRRAEAAWIKVKPCRYRKGAVVWMREPRW